MSITAARPYSRNLDLTRQYGLRVTAVFAISTAALNGDDATYSRLEGEIAHLTDARNAIAQKMISMLEGVAFDDQRIDKIKAELLILEADALVASVH